MKYRAEIDGLRALAVLPVMLFHAGVSAFSGGFVGVDVFFVISGYLITSILIGDIEKGRFSIVTFYERRARRILPALFFVILTILPVAWFLMLPDQMRMFGQSIVTTTLFVSNFFFWLQSDYFAPAAEEMPLLHTWSLAVEEQYYIFFPVFLFLAWKLGRRKVFWSIALIALASLVLSEWGWRNYPKANFFLAPSRVWELFAGSMAAFIALDKGVRANNLLAGLGLAAIVASIVLYDSATPFPSLYALLPVGGTVLIVLFAHQDTSVAKLLSWKPFVGVGLISYSAYLWHQPLLAFARIGSFDKPPLWLMLALCAVSLALAWFSWRFVERPFRQKSTPRRLIFSLSGIFMLALIGGGIAIAKADRNTYFQLANPTFEEERDIGGRWQSEPCPGFENAGERLSCERSIGEHRFKVVIWGDSHALVMRDKTPEIDQVKIINIAHAGCPPLLGLARIDRGPNADNCRDSEQFARYLEYINQQQPDLVILVGRWSAYLAESGQHGAGMAPSMAVSDGRDEEAVLSSEQVRLEMLRSALDRTIARIDSPKIALLDQPVDFSFMSRQEMVRTSNVPVERTLGYNGSRQDLFTGLVDVDVLHASSLFCDETNCETRRDGVQLYFDNNHLGLFGTHILWRDLLAPYLEQEARNARAEP